MPTPDLYWRVKTLFAEAVEMPADQRESFLRAQCEVEPQLYDEICSMLVAHERASAMLPSAADVPAESSDSHAAPSERAGEMIGPYKLLETIGEGGMGTVWTAEQSEPIRRIVALKLIKLGMDTSRVIARFEAERQALAVMDHPNVARVFDAGSTAAGRPYFVMELVKGQPLTDYCDKSNLSIAQRLELFVQVCQAVQHAHQKGLIHRDIKPSNVLVVTQDGRPLAKVIDFGIAKATQARLTEKTLFTEFRQLIGTPEYMSPEQASGDLDIDTRSDVYSLGVLLYELLTGTTPFDARELRSNAYAEMQRIIREVEPPKPSTRLSRNTQTLAGVAAHRQTEPRKLNASVRGELDWIVMKCLEKDRVRRYESASSLVTDIAHHLADEPVSAAAPSRAYRLRKFARRHRGPVLAVATIFVVLVAGIIGTTLGLIGQSRQRAIAEQQRTYAQKRERDAKQSASIATAVSKFQSDMLRSSSPFESGDKVTVVQVMTAAVKELDAGKLKDQPLVESNVRQIIGETLHELGRYTEAVPILRKALELCRSDASGPRLSIAHSLCSLAITLQECGQLSESESLMREALKINRTILPAGHQDIGASVSALGMLLQVEGKYDQAEPLCREALEIDRSNLPAGHADLASSLGKLGWLLQVEGKFAEAESLGREALEIRRRNLPSEHPDLSESLNILAVVLARTGRLAEAEPLFREMLQIDRKALPPGHPRIGQSLNNLAGVLMQQRKLAEAEPLLREGLELRRKFLPAGHAYIAQSLNNLGALLIDEEKFAEAEPLFREALAIRRSALPAEHADIASSLQNLGSLLHNQGKLAEAEALYREGLQSARAALPVGHPSIANVVSNLGLLLHEQEKFTEAEPLLREALEIRRKSLPAGHADIAKSLNRVALVLQDQGKFTEADPLTIEALDIQRKALPAGHLDLAKSLHARATLLLAMHKPAEAEPLILEAIAGYERAVGADNWQGGTARLLLGRTLAQLHRRADAESALLQAEHILAVRPGAPPKEYKACLAALITLYTDWNHDEPGQGYDAKATQWKSKLATLQPTTVPTSRP